MRSSNIHWASALGLAVALAAGNFVYQWQFADATNWRIATERSYFQAIAVFLAWLML